MYIKRESESNLNKWLITNKILLVLGARQVGKTTLINHFLQDKKVVFVNLDIDSEKAKFLALSSLSPAEAIKGFGNPDFLVIDEAQRHKETSRIVKGWYDFGVSTKIILLGSSSMNLLNQSAEALTGRNEKIFLPQLTFKEVISSQSWYVNQFTEEKLLENFSNQINSVLLQSVIYGSYPGVILSDNKEAFLLNLSGDYLLKDILQIGVLKDTEKLLKLLMLLAHQVGSEVSVNELATNLGISRITVEKYLELLEETFVIFRLPAFSTNQRKEISKNKKVYFWDNGIRNAILKEFSFSPMRSDIGKLWENWVISEFAKKDLLSGKKTNMYFWRSKSGSEVDLVVKENEKISAFEIKWKDKKINKKSFENLYNTKVKLISSDNPFI
jgi:predicted AAA+ superfamily ATPase